MGKVLKRPIVINDLIELATYIGNNNLDISDDFLLAAENTFAQLGNFPQLGKSSKFDSPELIDIRQKAVKGFESYLVFYRLIEDGVEIIRVIHGARNVEDILESDLDRDD
ncbi:type II toxin-antitoxin system RelE/ParE family toxin [Pleurocapsa sp. FMAR1]|uniref:type II toxin-antitoxin system RelE/ParE family toxin n=1 Tax=Pleurocapsa sp. FMAR1 TaxID=3040204 RepID=UPI0029C98F46|nr:type II toxin-antitoxin system RelE/ParE family toxin [Pleurocapsa sp. FMAR1]